MAFRSRVEKTYRIAVIASLDSFLGKLRKEVEKDKFLKDWISNGESSSGEEDFWEIIGAERAEDMSDKEFDVEVKDKADEWLMDSLEDFENKFKRLAKEEKGKLVGYRCIALADVDKFVAALKKGKYLKGFKGVGKWFSWNKDAAECHWGKGGSHVTVKALIPYSSIDVKQTAWANMSLSTGDEDEITLKEGAPIVVVEVLDENEDNLLEGVKPLPAVAET